MKRKLLKSTCQKIVLSCVFLLGMQLIVAQNNPTSIDFQGSTIEISNNLNSINLAEWPATSSIDGEIFGWMVFSNTPLQSSQDALKDNNVILKEYIGNSTYLFISNRTVNKSFLAQHGVTAITPLMPAMKMSADLKNLTIGDWATDGENISVQLQFMDLISREDASELLKINNISILESYAAGTSFQVSIPSDQLENVAQLNFVKYMEVIPAPSVKEDTDGRGLHRASNLDTQTATGRNYTGDGIGVLVRDDGIVGPHIDFQGRINNSGASGVGGTHGDGVAGILAGAGNLDPRNRGMAAGSTMYVSNYEASFIDTVTFNLISTGLVQITNSSYGNGCNAGYTSIAQTVDQQSITYPSVLHVFSAGNSGTSDCGYGVSGWGNITGGHKQGKNVIATANTSDDGILAASSSKGPATDGRIKPDITAHGQGHMSTNENNQYRAFGGTSGAAPGIAGVSAQLYEVYQDINGNLPDAGLIKGILLNTANDYGNVGPDFNYGWGMVNGLRAAQVIENGNYVSGSISQGVQRNLSLDIPSGVAQVKIMLYWKDPAASVGTTLSLVNDLDMTVTAPNGQVNNPYILNSTASSSLLNLPATTGIDRLNNMEQVVINSPIPGAYNINLTGFNVPQGPQQYYVIYDIIEDPIVLTYPIGGESFTPGTTEYIQWDAVNSSGDFSIQYSADNGASWNTIGTATATQRLFSWNVPNTVSGNSIIRVRNNGNSSTSPSTFSIANTPTNITVLQVCPTTMTITWDPVVGATSYDVYLLGVETMEVVGSSSSTSFTIPITNPSRDNWYAVRANGGNGWTGMRSVAQNHNTGLFNCSLNTDIAITSILNGADEFQSLCNPGPVMVTIQIANLGQLDQSNFDVMYQLNNNTPVIETFNGSLAAGTTIDYTFNTPLNITSSGPATLTVTNLITGDEQTNNDTIIYNFVAQNSSTSLDVTEDFEVSGVFPVGWVLENPDNDITWTEQTGVIGSNGASTTAAYVNNAAYTDRGEIDSFTTEFYDLNYNGTATLTFDLAKAQWSTAFNDELTVQISTDCGATFNDIYSKDGLTLATVPYISSSWSPTRAAEWRQETIDLSPYLGNHVQLKFVLLNDYSNSTFIDNISLNQTLSTDDSILEDSITLFPNPAKGFVQLKVSNPDVIGANIQIINSLGQQVGRAVLNNTITRIDTNAYSTGLYFVTISNGTLSTTKKLIIQ